MSGAFLPEVARRVAAGHHPLTLFQDERGGRQRQRAAGDPAPFHLPPAAFTRMQAEAIAATSKDTGRQALVFAAAKFINHRSLRDLRVDFAQLPYALHRVHGE